MKKPVLYTGLLCLIASHALAGERKETFTLDGTPVVVTLQPGPLGENHYKGSVEGNPGSWARLSLIDGQWQGLVSREGELHTIEPATDSSRNRVARALNDATLPFTCGTRHDTQAPATLQQAVKAVRADFDTICSKKVEGICAVAELELAFDKAFVAKYPSSYRDQATSLMNMVEGFYGENFGITFDTLSTTFLESDVLSASGASDDYLNEIARKKVSGELDFVTSQQALLHVVRGNPFTDDVTAGIAFINGLCDANGFSTGASALYEETPGGNVSLPLTALVITHEIGHNLGATHDGEGSNSCPTGFIMDPVVDPGANTFSDCSKREIKGLLGDLSNWPECTDYPVAFAIEALPDNELNVAGGGSVTHRANVLSSTGYYQPQSARLQASLDGATVSSATIGSAPCTLNPDNRGFSCQLGTGSLALQQLSYTLTPSQADARVTIEASFTADSNVHNISGSDGILSYSINSSGGPAAPGNLQGSFSNGTVTLSWTDNSNDETGFRIETSVNGGNWQTLATVVSNTTRYSHQPDSAALLQYRVIATGSPVDSAASNVYDLHTSGNGVLPKSKGGGGGSLTWLMLALPLLWWRQRSTQAEGTHSTGQVALPVTPSATLPTKTS